jgi:alkyldihydroxyacetonephosphate synthase
MSKKHEFYPEWYEEKCPDKSYRSIFKWGAVDEFKHPNRQLFKLMKKTFKMTDEDFKTRKLMGLDEVSFNLPCRLRPDQVDFLKKIVGIENIKTDNYSRLKVSYGKTMIDIMRLRQGIAENLPDVVIHPRDKRDSEEVVKYCNRFKIAVYVYGGGSSVTRGLEPVKGGVTLDLSVHMKKVLSLNEKNHTVTVEAGISGPELEHALNNAVSLFDAERPYTCGHFPQSFEYSTVGGWVVTRGAGQNSTLYGKIEDLVVCQEYITPAGIIKTRELPARATGPSVDQILIGSEGAYGILVTVTLRIFRFMQENTKRFSFIFKNWEDGKNAVREVMQSRFGYPSVFRLSDPEETDIAMKLYGVEGSIIDKIIKFRGYRQGERCLLLGTSEGDKNFTKLIKKKVKKICKKHKAMYTTGYASKKWEKSRFRDPYLRDDLQDFEIITDTLECSANWENIENVYRTVRGYCKQRPDTVCMTHISHFYPQGANLYFIFIGRMNSTEEYLEYQRGILDSIQRSGAAMSHHHGVGKMTAPWLEGDIGKNALGVLKALKKHFDPNNIMNPGGTLALDLSDSNKRNFTL